MANKRRDQPSGDKSVHHSNSKRDKCTLENVRLRELRVLLRRTEVGQLGLGPDIQEESQPAQVPLDHKVVDICAGSMHTVCLTKEGKVITFEYNDEGVTEGKEVDLPGKVIKISAGDSHTVALLEDERAFSWRTFRASQNKAKKKADREKQRLENLEVTQQPLAYPRVEELRLSRKGSSSRRSSRQRREAATTSAASAFTPSQTASSPLQTTAPVTTGLPSVVPTITPLTVSQAANRLDIPSPEPNTPSSMELTCESLIQSHLTPTEGRTEREIALEKSREAATTPAASAFTPSQTANSPLQTTAPVTTGLPSVVPTITPPTVDQAANTVDIPSPAPHTPSSMELTLESLISSYLPPTAGRTERENALEKAREAASVLLQGIAQIIDVILSSGGEGSTSSGSSRRRARNKRRSEEEENGVPEKARKARRSSRSGLVLPLGSSSTCGGSSSSSRDEEVPGCSNVTSENVRLRELKVLLRRTEVGQLGLAPNIPKESRPAAAPLDHKVGKVPVEQPTTSSPSSYRLCCVCGDTCPSNTCIRYGVYTCAGCTSFFCRSAKHDGDYKCRKNTENCVITKFTRTNCKLCRYKKCLEVGMSKKIRTRSKSPPQ